MRRRIPATLAALAALSLQTASAQAPAGAVAQAVGSAGCMRERPGDGCASAIGIDNPTAIVVSGDGRTVFAAANVSGAISSFSRDPASGAIAQHLAGAACFADGGADGCSDGLGLAGVSALALSPDGRSLYAAAGASSAVSAFVRSQNIGTISQLKNAGACTSSAPDPGGCAAGTALDGASGVAVSPDGKNVYVSAAAADAVAVFARSATTGALTQLAAPAGCVSESGANGCAHGSPLDGASAVLVTPDGQFVYVAAAASANAITGFRRDPATGALTQLATPGGCVADGNGGVCQPGLALGTPTALAISPDGRFLYVAAAGSDALDVLTRDPATGSIAQLAVPAGCVRQGGAAGCAAATRLDSPRSLALSPDGSVLYAASLVSDAVTVYARDAGSGGLTALPGRAGCVANGTPSDGCTGARSLDGADAVAVAPDGRGVYVGSSVSDSLALLVADVAPTCVDSTPRAVANAGTRIVLACSDLNGQPVTRSVTAPPAHGVLGPVDPNTGAATYTPAPGYVGPDSVTFSATDGLSQSPPATVRITVSPPSRGPAVTLGVANGRVAAGAFRVTLGCPATAIGTCHIRVRVLARAGTPQTALAVRAVTIAGGKRITVPLRLTPPARRTLAARHRIAVLLVVAARDGSGHDTRLERPALVRSAA